MSFLTGFIIGGIVVMIIGTIWLIWLLSGAYK